MYGCKLEGAGRLIDGRYAMLLLSAGGIRLLRCDGKSAGAGKLIDGNDTMLFLSMINGGNTTLLLAGAGGLINGRDTILFHSAG
jgi:hypothetical protein